MKVLVIDDDANILELTRQTLIASGHDVITAVTGEAGIASAKRDNPDLAIVDLALPGIDGYEVIRELKTAFKDGPFFPVILFTAADEVSNRVRGFQVGCDDFLGKPVDLHELKARVHSLLTRRAQDKELRRMNERLREMHKLKEDLASLVVHDLRNPLSALAGNVELLEDELREASPMVRDSLNDCKVLAARALSLLAGLLDVAQLEEGILRTQRSESPVRDLLEAGARTSSAYVKSRNLKLIIDVQPPELTARVDVELMGRIFENLVANAVRYATSGGTLCLSARREGDAIVFTVGNDGPPIPMEDRPRIFEKFYRIEERRAGARANRGLGLYFCRLAAEAHDGTISAVETKEYPTTFVITIPQPQPQSR
jgi:signal transduction histidine kinase